MKIGGVQVLYNPNKELLIKSIKSILSQLDYLVIIDNSRINNKYIIDTINIDKIIFIFNNCNLGIAEAQNIGINILKDKNVDFVYFIDQDSISSANLVSTLVNNYIWLEENNFNPGIIGPIIINRQTATKYEGKIMKGKLVKDNIIEMSEIISSGSLISYKTIQEIGIMDSSLFIDYVDHEWCWRAKSLGSYKSYCCTDIELNHQIGEGDHYFCGINILISTPFRCYYQYRNYILLLMRSYVPLYWKCANGIKLFFKLLYYCIIYSPKKYTKSIAKGILDGIKLIIRK